MRFGLNKKGIEILQIKEQYDGVNIDILKNELTKVINDTSYSETLKNLLINGSKQQVMESLKQKYMGNIQEIKKDYYDYISSEKNIMIVTAKNYKGITLTSSISNPIKDDRYDTLISLFKTKKDYYGTLMSILFSICNFDNTFSFEFSEDCEKILISEKIPDEVFENLEITFENYTLMFFKECKNITNCISEVFQSNRHRCFRNIELDFKNLTKESESLIDNFEIFIDLKKSLLKIQEIGYCNVLNKFNDTQLIDVFSKKCAVILCNKNLFKFKSCDELYDFLITSNKFSISQAELFVKKNLNIFDKYLLTGYNENNYVFVEKRFKFDFSKINNFDLDLIDDKILFFMQLIKSRISFMGYNVDSCFDKKFFNESFKYESNILSCSIRYKYELCNIESCNIHNLLSKLKVAIDKIYFKVGIL